MSTEQATLQQQLIEGNVSEEVRDQLAALAPDEAREVLEAVRQDGGVSVVLTLALGGLTPASEVLGLEALSKKDARAFQRKWSKGRNAFAKRKAGAPRGDMSRVEGRPAVRKIRFVHHKYKPETVVVLCELAGEENAISAYRMAVPPLPESLVCPADCKSVSVLDEQLRWGVAFTGDEDDVAFLDFQG